MDYLICSVLVSLHILLSIALYFISKSFDLNGFLVKRIFKNVSQLTTFLIILSISTFLLFIFLIKINKDYVQIINFLISFFLIFEICMKIANSERFINWIGENLEKSIRSLIMFVISLNCTYFFTRLTDQIIRSQGI